jgi:hypothetical protein
MEEGCLEGGLWQVGGLQYYYWGRYNGRSPRHRRIDAEDQQSDINPSVQFVPYVGHHAVVVQAE